MTTTDELHRQWGRNLKEARGDFWSQKGLAQVCGISPGALSNIESGRRCPTDGIKLRLAGALRRPVGELFPWPQEIPEFPMLLREQRNGGRAA